MNKLAEHAGYRVQINQPVRRLQTQIQKRPF